MKTFRRIVCGLSVLLLLGLMVSCNDDDGPDVPDPDKVKAPVSHQEFMEKATGKLWIGKSSTWFKSDGSVLRDDEYELIPIGDGPETGYYFTKEGVLTLFYIYPLSSEYDTNKLSKNIPYCYDEVSGQWFESAEIPTIRWDYYTKYIVSLSGDEMVLHTSFGWHREYGMPKEESAKSYVVEVLRVATPEEEAKMRSEYVATNY